MQVVNAVHRELGSDVSPVGQERATALELKVPGAAVYGAMSTSEIRDSTPLMPGQYTPAAMQEEMSPTAVVVPLARLGPGRMFTQDVTAAPEAALPVPDGHGIGAMLDAYVPVCAVRLLIVTSLERLKAPAAAPGQYVLTGAPMLHNVRSPTDVVETPRGSVKAQPCERVEHAATLDPEAALVVPLGHLSATALESYVPADAT